VFLNLGTLLRKPLATAAFAVLVLLVLLAVAGPLIDHHGPAQVDLGAVLLPPGEAHLFGTDQLGRDVLARVVAGTRVTLEVGFGASLVATVLGVLIGGAAAFLGGWLDSLLNQVTGLFMVIPSFFLAVVVASLFGQSVFDIIATIGLLSWPIIARVARAEVNSLKNRGFVDAATILGVRRFAVLTRHILPNAAGPITVTATLTAGAAMLLEAGLSYLGLGDPNHPSLGLQLQQSQQLMTVAWWTAVFPGAFLFAAVLAVNLTGDGLAAVFNPRSAR
jgi:peptide/nickel transport system permease protein